MSAPAAAGPAISYPVPSTPVGGTAPPGVPPGGWNVPTAPPVAGSTAQQYGPYAWDAPLAQQAYSDALAQLAQQRTSMYQAYGADSTGAWDETNPFGAYEQAQTAGAQAGNQVDASMLHRGLANSGLAAQGQEAAQQADQQQVYQLNQGLLTGNEKLDQASTAAQDALNQRQFQDQLAQDQYNQAHGIFTVAGPERSQAGMDQMIAAMYKAWQAAYGQAGKGGRKAGQNLDGLTFQQRLDQLGQQLWDPTFGFQVGTQKFGGTA